MSIYYDFYYQFFIHIYLTLTAYPVDSTEVSDVWPDHLCKFGKKICMRMRVHPCHILCRVWRLRDVIKRNISKTRLGFRMNDCTLYSCGPDFSRQLLIAASVSKCAMRNWHVKYDMLCPYVLEHSNVKIERGRKAPVQSFNHERPYWLSWPQREHPASRPPC